MSILCPHNRGKLTETGARGFALFIGLYTLLNVTAVSFGRGADLNIWWVDLRVLPPGVSVTLLLSAVALLIAFALAPRQRAWRRNAFLACCAVLLVAVLANATMFYVLLLTGRIHSGFPLALSLLAGAGLGNALWFVARTERTFEAPIRLRFVLLASLCLAGAFPLLQMFCFGKTDYRRPADVAVVLGARVYADGRPSDALADRVRTACQLYQKGLAKKLLLSGGPGDGAVHETEGMRRMAVKLGVRPEDILLDEAGLNTRATARNTKSILQDLHASRVLVVSHFYHLPRIKMAYQQSGMEVFTVPARESYILRQLPFNMAREVAAFWAYCLFPGR